MDIVDEDVRAGLSKDGTGDVVRRGEPRGEVPSDKDSAMSEPAMETCRSLGDLSPCVLNKPDRH